MMQEQIIREQVMPNAVKKVRPEHTEYVQVMLNKTQSGFTAFNGGEVLHNNNKARTYSVGSGHTEQTSKRFYSKAYQWSGVV